MPLAGAVELALRLHQFRNLEIFKRGVYRVVLSIECDDDAVADAHGAAAAPEPPQRSRSASASDPSGGAAAEAEPFAGAARSRRRSVAGRQPAGRRRSSRVDVDDAAATTLLGRKRALPYAIPAASREPESVCGDITISDSGISEEPRLDDTTATFISRAVLVRYNDECFTFDDCALFRLEKDVVDLHRPLVAVAVLERADFTTNTDGTCVRSSGFSEEQRLSFAIRVDDGGSNIYLPMVFRQPAQSVLHATLHACVTAIRFVPPASPRSAEGMPGGAAQPALDTAPTYSEWATLFLRGQGGVAIADTPTADALPEGDVSVASLALTDEEALSIHRYVVGPLVRAHAIFRAHARRVDERCGADEPTVPPLRAPRRCYGSSAESPRRPGPPPPPAALPAEPGSPVARDEPQDAFGLSLVKSHDRCFAGRLRRRGVADLCEALSAEVAHVAEALFMAWRAVVIDPPAGATDEGLECLREDWILSSEEFVRRRVLSRDLPLEEFLHSSKESASAGDMLARASRVAATAEQHVASAAILDSDLFAASEGGADAVPVYFEDHYHLPQRGARGAPPPPPPRSSSLPRPGVGDVAAASPSSDAAGVSAPGDSTVGGYAAPPEATAATAAGGAGTAQAASQCNGRADAAASAANGSNTPAAGEPAAEEFGIRRMRTLYSRQLRRSGSPSTWSAGDGDSARARRSRRKPAVHLVVLQNGLHGTEHDLKRFRGHLKLLCPHVHAMIATSNTLEKTDNDIAVAGARLAVEVAEYIEAKVTGAGKRLGRLSFVGHSLGGVLVRVALRHPCLRRFVPLLHAYVSLAVPHTGLAFGSSVVHTGLFLLRKWRRSTSLAQLSLTDAARLEGSLLYALAVDADSAAKRVAAGIDAVAAATPGGGAAAGGEAHADVGGELLPAFQRILLVSSPQDTYCPWHSGAVQLYYGDSPPAEGTKEAARLMAHTTMVAGLWRGVDPARVTRVSVCFSFGGRSSGVDKLVGRAAHVAVLESDAFLAGLVLRYKGLFDPPPEGVAP